MLMGRGGALADEIRKLRGELRDAERAEEPDKAITVLAQLCELEPNDLRSRQKLAGYLSRTGQLAEAQSHLQQCANGYAMEGFLNKAIQVVKELVQLNPADEVALRGLQGLYARRHRGRSSAGPIPGFQLPPGGRELWGSDPIEVDFEDVPTAVDGEGEPSFPPTLIPRSASSREKTPSYPDEPDADPGTGSRRTLQPLTGTERDLGELIASASAEARREPADQFGQPGLRDIPLFSRVPDEALDLIAQRAEEKDFEPGETLFHQGDWESNLWLILHGRLEVKRRTTAGHELTLARLGPGAPLGEMSIFNDSPRTASAHALTHLKCYRLRRSDLQEIWQEFPKIRDLLLREYRLRHLRNLVDHAPVMQAIPKAMRRGVAMLFKVREVPAGTLLLDAGGEAGGLFGVLGGRVRVEMRSEAGDYRMLAVMSQGAVFGGEELVIGERLGLRYVTAGRASVLRLPADVYHRLLDEHPSLKAYLERVAIQRRRLAQEIITAQDLFHG
tara:strand:- start:1320 stop:2825 length:1506 start_codon:yes stop_codon:yes gene_type:complete